MPTFTDRVRIMLCPNMTLVDKLTRIHLFVYLTKFAKRAHSQCLCSAICKIATVVDGHLETRVTAANSNIDGIDRGEVISRLSFEIDPFLVRILNSTLLSFHSGNCGNVNGCYRYSMGTNCIH